MKQIKTLIIVLISILIVGIGTLIALYFATDIFKSNKQMFNNYLGKLDFSTFIDMQDLAKLGTRIEEEPYSIQGNLSIEMKSDEEYMGDEAVSINEGFEYTIKNDPSKKYSSAEVDYKQDGENKLTVNYLRNEDLYGLQFKDIVNQYIVLENNNLKEFAEKIGITDLDKIPNKIDAESILQNVNVDEIPNVEELIGQIKQIGKKYANTFINQIPDKNYTKIKKEEIVVDGKTINSDGYKVRLTGEELSNILSSVLEIAKQDNDIYNLVSKLINDENFDLETYQNLIEYYSEIDTGSIEYLDISLYKQGNKLIKTYIELKVKEESTNVVFAIENNKSIVINAKKDDEYENYEVNISIAKGNDVDPLDIKVVGKQDGEEMANIALLLSKTGKSSEQNVKTNISLESIIGEMGTIKIQSNNNVSFGLDEDIEEFKEGEYGILNNFNEEQLGNLAINLGERISQKINFENTIIGGMITSLNGSLFNKARESSEETEKQMIYEQTVATITLNDNGELDVDATGKNAAAYFTENTDLMATWNYTDETDSGILEISGNTRTYEILISVDEIKIK